MNDRSRLLKLAGHLQAEIQAARAGDTQGQFPILDLIGNLRDESAGAGDLAPLEKLCVDAWECVVKIVESGKPFATGEIVWLKELLSQIQGLLAIAPPALASAIAGPPAP